METWKAIPGWEALYEVSDHGRVRSLDRTVFTRRHGWTKYKGRVLAHHTSKNGYPIATLTKPGQKPICFNIHILVLHAFVGPPQAGQECCHADDVPTNNHISNLRWDTRKSNHADAKRNGRLRPARGVAAGNAKVTEDTVRWIREFGRAWGVRDTGRLFDISHTTVRHILEGDTWGHVT